MTEKDQLINRVTKIEREVRIWRVLGAAAVACFGLIITLGARQNPEIPRLLKAKEFSLVDDDGNVRAKLESRGNFTYFRMYDGTKQSEVAFVANNTKAGLHLYNDNRINSAIIEAYPSGGGLGLSRKTGDGRSLTQVVGGTEGNFVKFEPLKGDEVRIPRE
jgi:hypothetical protein